MNVEIATEAMKFLEKEYINGIFVALCFGTLTDTLRGLYLPSLFTLLSELKIRLFEKSRILLVLDLI